MSRQDKLLLQSIREVYALKQEKLALELLIQQLREVNENLLRAKLEISHLAHHDFLTNLPNRVQLNERLTQATALAYRKQRKLAVLFLDLDRFKSINDSLGHSVGDKLLQGVAQRLRDCVRTSDTVSRQGGDEFVILLAELEHEDDAALIAEKILAALARPFQVCEHTIHVSTSIGISVYPTDSMQADDLIKHADTAMYHAKENGRSQFEFFKPEMNQIAVERQAVEADLRAALAGREFCLYYQPKVNLESGVITGAEALIRWHHPQRGLLEPGQFIAIAEDSGLITGIGRWVLGEACRQARIWQDSGRMNGRIAVNISAVEFRQGDFVAYLRAILEDTGFDPNCLELELTESVLMNNALATITLLKELKTLGVHLAIDDFGTGYSSLSYLKQFSIDALKIDQSFVRDIINECDDAVIVDAVINIGASLKQRVIAEGIETCEQVNFLRSHHCEEGQGYFFSVPLEAEAFTRLLERGVELPY
jgi:diguanylate cyclase (GGDEF)-like protein